MRIAIGADHAGFELKECVKARLLEWKQDVLDLDNALTELAEFDERKAKLVELILHSA